MPPCVCAAWQLCKQPCAGLLLHRALLYQAASVPQSDSCSATWRATAAGTRAGRIRAVGEVSGLLNTGGLGRRMQMQVPLRQRPPPLSSASHPLTHLCPTPCLACHLAARTTSPERTRRVSQQAQQMACAMPAAGRWLVHQRPPSGSQAALACEAQQQPTDCALRLFSTSPACCRAPLAGLPCSLARPKTHRLQPTRRPWQVRVKGRMCI